MGSSNAALPVRQMGGSETADDPNYVSPTFDNAPNDLDKQLEYSVSMLEDLAEVTEGRIRPGSMGRTVATPQTAQSQPSRLPHLLELSGRRTYLLDRVYEILPIRQALQHIVRRYVDGGIHRGWHASSRQYHPSTYLSIRIYRSYTFLLS